MSSLSLILVPFAFRLTFGVALAMRITPAQLVSSGFFRVHLWVLLGVNTFTGLILFNGMGNARYDFHYGPTTLALTLLLVVTCYLGSVCWLYQWHRLGGLALSFIVLSGLAAAILTMPWNARTTVISITLGLLDVVSSGLLLGSILSAMLLGHWYLNAPSMTLTPLNRLVLLLIAAALFRTLICGIGSTLVMLDSSVSPLLGTWLAFRWIAGLLGTLVIAWFTRLTLAVPNTQSATGLLYAGVVLAFMGELIAAMVSAEYQYPV
ncbi:MAG: hypothetical protein CMJ59_01565 [Planctomycetaceae bacterium]|nr:hypothetical protein [Planctomycetaceae bacterium]